MPLTIKVWLGIHEAGVSVSSSKLGSHAMAINASELLRHAHITLSLLSNGANYLSQW